MEGSSSNASSARELRDLSADLTSLERQLLAAGFWAVYRGESPSATELAAELATPLGEVSLAVEKLLGRGLMTADEQGRANGSDGLSLVPSPHSLMLETGLRYTWCAVDAVGIPAALGVDAEVLSSCFHCGRDVALSFRCGEPQGAPAVSLRIGVGTAVTSGKVNEDVCPVVNFFCSQGHAEAWAAGVPEARIIGVAQAAELGRSLWADVL